jgi:hypothetical protein
VDLACEPCPFGERRVRRIHLAQPAQLGVGASERGEIRGELGLDPRREDRVEHEPQGVGRADDAGGDDRVEGEVQLAEGGDDEAG